MNLPSRAAAVGLMVAAAACQDRPVAKRTAAAAGDAAVVADSMGAAPTQIATVAVKTTRKLRENSALALSPTQPGVLFTINDSGNEPILFALDTAGADRGAWRIKQATNVDWEALAIGTCGRGTSTCIYIGDVGDNDGKHPTRTLYRVAEPPAKDASFSGTLSAEQVSFTYPDRDPDHDVEAMYVARNGDTFLITKRPLRGAGGRLRSALVFRIPATTWAQKRTTVAELADSLSVVPGSALLRTITDASLSSDARHLAVRTYNQLFVYSTDPATGRVIGSVAPAICNLTPLGEAQGEGVTWLSLSGRFALSSEGQDAPLHLATCPLPH